MKNIFKVLSLVLLVGAMFTLTSCKKEAKDLIIGKWNLTSATSTDAGITQALTMILNKATFEFTENGVMTITTNTGNSMIDDIYKTSANYTVDGDKLNISLTDSTGLDFGTATIKEITKNKMTLYTNADNMELTMGFEKI